jgi:MoaA/NifB/PqqE/SkfB family radical SAM enzyme
MIDVSFYTKTHSLKKSVMAGGKPQNVQKSLEWLRSKEPIVFNIESTNSCNQACFFCPRTKLMTRPVKTMDTAVFMKIALQLKPHPDKLWAEWVEFAEREYNVPRYEQSEDAFFLYILTRVLVLHGYGDPLLDPHMADYVGILTRAGVPSYFSCNPMNIHLGKVANCFENGLTYIKYSIDSLKSSARGRDAFKADYPKIMQVLEMKAKKGFKTKVIITMINLGQDEFGALQEAFKGTDVYIYQKSLDQTWMVGGQKPKSIHWSEPCQIPWSSMTINSGGYAVMCEEDYDGEVILGDAKVQSLNDIWNGDIYTELRKAHFAGNADKCWNRCDMIPYGKWLK